MLPKTLFKKAIQFACVLLSTVYCLNTYAEPSFSFNETEPTLHVNFDECVSFFGGSSTDFSEFTAISVANPDCSGLELIGGSVYRNNPEINGHSCAPGFVNNAMCIDGLDNCNYVAGDDKSLRFDVQVIPEISGFGALKEISFYHQAPENFTFLEGSTGINNYPTLLGIRVLVDGIELYKNEAIPTTRVWSQFSIDFSVLNGFTVSDTTTFNIEILPYCLIGNGALVKAWDIDELTIVGGCNDVNGGLVTTGESTTVCSSDTTSSIRSFEVALESGANFSWILTDNNRQILEISDTGSFDFDNFPNGLFNVYHIAFETNLSGLGLNENIADLTGCFDFSNAISINNSKVIGGSLSSSSGEPILICSLDSMANLVSVDLTGATGTQSTYVITNETGIIISVQESNALDFLNISEGQYSITAYSHNGDLNAVVNTNVATLEGCIASSNSIDLIKSIVNGGTISFAGQDTITACESNSLMTSPNILGAFGENMAWLVITPSELIVALSDTLPIDISIMNFNSVEIRHISYLDGISGLVIGGRLESIEGCYEFSNAIQVMLPEVNGGDISINNDTSLAICTNVTGNQFIVDIDEVSGTSSTLFITDTNGEILDVVSGNEVNFDNANQGSCLIWNISFEDNISGLEIGENIDNISGCFNISNSIAVERIQIIGGELTSDQNTNTITICSGDGIDDPIVFTASNFQGQSSELVVTDINGVIINTPGSDSINFEGAPEGTCLVYNIVYLDQETDISTGINVDSLGGCYALSNAITIIRDEVDGGSLLLDNGMTTIDVIVGDGVDEAINVNLTNNIGDNATWVITDSTGMILELPSAPPFNFENAGQGVCLIWNLSSNGSVSGLDIGSNVNDLVGCFHFSNEITVTRTLLEGGTLTLINGDTTISVCVGDAIIDSIDVVISGNEGPSTGWIITDTNGLILDLPISPPFIFENAPAGICQIWHISFINTLTGLTVGENVSGITGAFNLSNAVEVTRNQVDGGQIEGPGGATVFNVCSGDGNDDEILAMVINNVGDNNQWVITDENNVILQLPTMPPFNFENAPTGTCFIYNVAYLDTIEGLEVDSTLSNVIGCYDLSNAITVIRDFVDSGIISTSTGQDTIEIIIGDNLIDSINISVIDAIGDSSDWVITDTLGVILDITDGSPFTFENAGAGTCLVYHLSSLDTVSNLTVGENIINNEGCYEFSNAITIIRTEVNGGSIITIDGTTEVELCIIDQEDSFVGVVLTGIAGDSSEWIITDDTGVILELPIGSPFNFGTAPTGVCQIWHLSSIGPVTGLTVGENVSGIAGTFNLSNAINVIRSAVDGGILLTDMNEDTISIIANDGVSDAFDVILMGAVGDSLNWLITDESGDIIGLPSAPPFDFEDAGAGICQLWNISYNDTIGGFNLGANVSGLTGCFDLSTPITVIREAIDGGNIETPEGLTEITVCLSDMLSDSIDVILTDTSSINSAWVITDTFGLILDLPIGPPFDFGSASPGVCQIWHLSYDNGLTGLEIDSLVSNLNGAFDFSNSITLTRDSLAGGDITLPNGMLTDSIVVGDGIIDSIFVNLTNATGDSMTWVITDTLGIILDLPDSPPFTFENAGGGVCLIWNLSYSTGIQGLSVGENASDLIGCFDLSNAITIVRQGLMGGTLTTIDTLTSLSTCAGDGESDAFDVILTDTLGPVFSWVITDTTGVILGLPASPPFDLEGAGSGICRVWNLTHEAGLTGLVVGQNVDTLMGNHMFSNPIEVTRIVATGGTIEITTGLTELTIVVGEGITDTIVATLIDTVGQNFAWVVTNTFGVILELPITDTFYFENAGGGVCQIWNLTYADGLTGLTIGENINDLVGCHDFSNNIEITRIPTILNGGVISSDDLLTEIDICVGDGITTPIDILISDNEGPNEQWIVTDTFGLILGLPSAPPIDLELAGGGICRIWNLAYSNGLLGLDVNSNINDLVGFFHFSNPITVNRTSVDGGDLETSTGLTEITILIGDGIIDSIDVVLSGTEGDTLLWVVTDTLGNILDLPTAPPFILENAGSGVCQIWNLSHTNAITGLQVGNNVSQVMGCFALSNAITVTREGLNGGTLTDLNGNTTVDICLSFGNVDSLFVMLADTNATFNQWIFTDIMGEIIDLPTAAPFDLSLAGVGQCLLFNVGYDTIPGNLTVGDTIINLTGTFDLSNPLTVNRNAVAGGNLTFEDGSLIDTINVDDAILDSIFVDLSGFIGDTTQWIVTDTFGNILDLPLDEPFTFENTGGGTCNIWNISYLLGLQGLAVGNNVSQLDGCFDLSNSITLFKEGLSGGAVTFTDGSIFTEICRGDGIADSLDITIQGAQGAFQEKFMTTKAGQIFTIGNAAFPFNFENILSVPALDTFIIYNISYDVIPTGFEKNLFISGIAGDFALSNSVIVKRNYIEGGSISDANGDISSTIIIGDGIADTLTLSLTGSLGDSLVWVVTSELDTIIGFQDSPEFIYQESEPQGIQKIYHAALLEAGLTGLEVGMNINDVQGCFGLSNVYTLTRKQLNGGMLTTTAGDTLVNLCIGDTNDDFVNVVRTGQLGSQFSFVVTNSNGLIDFIPSSSTIEFTSPGTSHIYNISHDGSLTGLTPGQNISGLGGCFQLSNRVVVEAELVFASTLNYSGSGNSDPESVCVGDGNDDIISWIGFETDSFVYAITDTFNVIDTLIVNSIFNFENSPVGHCRIYSISYAGDLLAQPGDTITTGILASNCALISANFLTMIKEDCSTPTAAFDFSLFPNPAISELTLDLRKRPYEESTIEIFSSEGKKIKTQSVKMNNNMIDISSFHPGVYYIKIYSKGLSDIKKFIVLE